ncbi:MAG: aminomethyl transferase family protein [Rhodospirillales bacterium]|jgi:aminomethyltransferase|nr:aminomethyl transferase family protein [Rhodospirillales bacterium]MBT4040711.1 aminomethyl transferase family protein [Rhodospirillales bacterium]MBT4627393.1 aminomethyl transferase family protein [Rhodospirillales bacterium]MBT5353001.1 aminomethyl transferase family protein [Rhodospirillales bacterium]MBT5519622.1 aminomethyl transferase family protein [Rhodospirillales bacterium]
MTEELSRTSALAERHRALGSGLEDWNGMGTAWTYDSNPNDEHDAVREAVGMFDMSPLKKVFLRGSDAAAVLDHTITRDVSRIAVGQSAYTSVLTEEGGVADDAIVSSIGNGEWMVAHGSGDMMALLGASATGKDVFIEFTDDLHDISVQGPGALGVIDANCSIDLAPMKYFHHATAEIFGHACRLSRTGYTGERGYEIFATADVIVDIWDNLAGAGVAPCSFTALDKVRIEAGLLFYGYDMSSSQTPWEVGLGFTVNRTKSDFRGKTALMAAEGSERVRNVGLVIDHGDMVNGEEVLSVDGRTVGVVNSPCYSHRLGKSLALGHIEVSVPDGTILALAGGDISTTATVVSLPIYDPQKAKTHAG